MSASRRWGWRAGFTLAIFAGLQVGGARLDFDPDPVRLFLVVALVAGLAGLLVDVIPDETPPWEFDVIHMAVTRGADQRTGFYVRLLESHLKARTPDESVRDRLADLADQTLRLRHDERLCTARGRELLGPEVVRVVDGPLRRLSVIEIERAITRIEEL
ncbi:MAG: hypothetical protein WKF79_00660 [Nocardioides sp.]